MFTGLIEAVGAVEAITPGASGFRLCVRTVLAADLETGESLAVNGACLTVAALEGDRVCADIGPETVRVTTLGSLPPGRQVNLERAMRAGDRFGGHFVQGHVDGTATLDSVREDGESRWLTFTCGEALHAGLIPKGSVAVDGVSLTVADLRRGAFDVMVVPFTWAHTNLCGLRRGDRVNLECDIIGKYVARATQLALADK